MRDTHCATAVDGKTGSGEVRFAGHLRNLVEVAVLIEALAFNQISGTPTLARASSNQTCDVHPARATVVPSRGPIVPSLRFPNVAVL